MMYEYLGPPFEEGPLPAVFYFALSAHDSLHLDPFNQPARFLSIYPIRVFSITLPGHHLPATEALTDWANDIRKGVTLFENFSALVIEVIETLLAQNVIEKGKLGFVGLSRGGFIAAYIAAKTPLVSHILGFAPLTKLSHVKEFQGMDMEAFELDHLVSHLSTRKIRFYIGNRDTRVGTAHCYHLFSALVEDAYQKRISSPPLELIIGPSVGHQGHGTLPPVFQAGANWLASQLGCIHAT